MTPDDTLKGLNTNLDNANKAIEIALQQLNDAVQALKVANMAMNIAATPKCEAHGKWPCRECGTTHYDGCKCYFCKPKLEVIKGGKE